MGDPTKVEPGLEPDVCGDDTSSKAKDFQSQFLEFSQRRQQQLDTDSMTEGLDKTKGGDIKGGVSHIAALLQVSIRFHLAACCHEPHVGICCSVLAFMHWNSVKLYFLVAILMRSLVLSVTPKKQKSFPGDFDT